MPVITFDKQHLDEGFMFLARRGEVGCLPNDVFAINDALLDLLKQSNIPFTQMEKHRSTSWRKEIWTKKWSRLQVLTLVLVLLVPLLLLHVPKALYYLQRH
jgi:hypothetical protein